MPDAVGGTDNLVPSYFRKQAAQEANAQTAAPGELVPSYYQKMATQEAAGTDTALVPTYVQGAQGGGAALAPDYKNNLIGVSALQNAANASSVDVAPIKEMYRKLAGRDATDFEIQVAADALAAGVSQNDLMFELFGSPTNIKSKPGAVEASPATFATATGAAKGDPYALASGLATPGTKTAGAVVTMSQDGTKVAQYANGVTATVTKDGTTVIQDPNTKTTSVYTPNGFTIEAQRRQFTDKDGQTKFYWDSTITDPDGKTDIVWGDPHVIGANGKKFDFHDEKARLFNFAGGTVDVQNKSYMGGSYKVQDVLTINVPGLNVQLEAGGKSTVSVGTGGNYTTTVKQDVATGATEAYSFRGISYYDSAAVPPEAADLDQKNLKQNTTEENFRQRAAALIAVGADKIKTALSDAWTQLVDTVKAVLDGTGLRQK